MLSPRTRSSIAALAVTALFLVVSCSPETPTNDASRDEVPATLAPRPTPRAQPPVKLVITPPAWQLNGYAAGSGRQVWNQSMDLVRDWLLRPALVMQHEVKPDELDGIARLMVPESAEAWLKVAHRAVEGRRNLSGTEERRTRAEGAVNQLVFWNVDLASGRGWDNPMFTPAKVTGGQVIGGDNLTVVFTVDTAARLRGHGLDYEIPYRTALWLVWKKVGNGWKLQTWSRTVSGGKEKLVGPPEAVASSEAAKAARRSARPNPSSSGSSRPKVTNSAP
jgi:hypothetical protein